MLVYKYKSVLLAGYPDVVMVDNVVLSSSSQCDKARL